MLTVYSSSTCPKCKVLKMKLDKTGIEYETCQDIEVMKELGINSIPVLQLADGELLDFKAAVDFVNNKLGGD